MSGENAADKIEPRMGQNGSGCRIPHGDRPVCTSFHDFGPICRPAYGFGPDEEAVRSQHADLLALGQGHEYEIFFGPVSIGCRCTTGFAATGFAATGAGVGAAFSGSIGGEPQAMATRLTSKKGRTTIASIIASVCARYRTGLSLRHSRMADSMDRLANESIPGNRILSPGSAGWLDVGVPVEWPLWKEL